MSTPTVSHGPEVGNDVSRAAGYLGLAIRYGYPPEDIEAARAAFETAKLLREIQRSCPSLNRKQRASLVAAIKSTGA